MQHHTQHHLLELVARLSLIVSVELFRQPLQSHTQSILLVQPSWRRPMQLQALHCQQLCLAVGCKLWLQQCRVQQLGCLWQ